MSKRIRWRAHLVICLILIAISAFVFLQTLDFAFTNYDDDKYVRDNPYVRAGLSNQSIKWASMAAYEGTWQPLVWLSFMADRQFQGHEPGGYHLTNVLLHILSSLLLFLTLNRMTRSIWRSGFVAALFAIHPLHVESVAWIAERKDVLSGF
ncbi:MAG: hypothetical protein Q7N50_00580, partial [Armatimonadota bacterium]|nr:hypothetical protein [Armatimonadota bacterium]